MKIHSETASLESIRKYLRMKLARAPKINPTSRDKKDKIKKSNMIVKAVPVLIYLSELAITALKMIIVTISLTTPSPKSKLNSFGCSL